jgi:hypothetical protein
MGSAARHPAIGVAVPGSARNSLESTFLAMRMANFRLAFAAFLRRSHTISIVTTWAA